ncbi:hypothetical protein UR09_04625 [Candidatus Nitromaritima sp. SCGC AAA799-A02]|nr:hypothetical protein UR09_04625 [Candidatus Nitromaritima sp. SCGC AAA799-A02]
MRHGILLSMILFLLLAPASVSAHGGGHSKEAAAPQEEAPAFQDSIYAVEDGGENEMPPIGGDPMGSPLSRTDLLGGDDPLADMEMGEPMMRTREGEHKDDMMPMDGPEKHEQHIDKATHEWVSTHNRGYGAAVGITLLSGLVFGVLSFLRIGEKSS